MKKYFVKYYSDFVNVYTVCSAEDSATVSALRENGFERITLKTADTLCRRERQRRKSGFGGFASETISSAYICADDTIAFI